MPIPEPTSTIQRLEKPLDDDDAHYVSQIEAWLAAGGDELVDWEEIKADVDLSA